MVQTFKLAERLLSERPTRIKSYWRDDAIDRVCLISTMSHDGEDIPPFVQLSGTLKTSATSANRDVLSLRSTKSSPVALVPSRSSDAEGLAAPRDQNAEMPKKEALVTAQSAADGADHLARKQRRLISLTDQVLLKRTQILHQQGSVKTCRKFLNASLKELNAAIDLLALQDPETHKDTKVSIASQDKVKVELEGAADEGSSLTDTAVLHGEPSAAGIGPLPINTSNLEKKPVISKNASLSSLKQPTAKEINRIRRIAYEQYQTDIQTTITQEEDLNAMTDELSKLEYALAQLHRSFAEHVKAVNFARELHSSLLDLNLGTERSLTWTTGAESETPPLVSEYFEQKGDEGVYRERLQDLEFSFHEGLVERELITERGDKLDVSDEVFRQNYDERRKDLNEEIFVAEEKAASLARRCAEAGLDIEKYRRIRPSEPTGSTVGHVYSGFGPKVAADEVLAVETSFFVEPKARTPIDERTSSRVGKWLRTVRDPDQPMIIEGWTFPGETHTEE